MDFVFEGVGCLEISYIYSTEILCDEVTDLTVQGSFGSHVRMSPFSLHMMKYQPQ